MSTIVAEGAKKKNHLTGIRYAAALFVAATAGYACLYTTRLFSVSTDDSYVQADTVTVTPKVAAYVTALHVSDNSSFKKGDLLVELDPRDFNVSLQQAAAALSAATAEKANVIARMAEQQHVIAAAQATLSGDRSTLNFSRQQLDRYNTLARDGAGARERSELASSDVGQHAAVVEHDEASLNEAKAQVLVLQSQSAQADASIEKAQATLVQARLDLSYTKIYSDSDGTVANKTVQIGNYVQPGQALFAAVPRDVYLIANIKETQMSSVRPGQRVTFTVDSLDGEVFHGHVDSVQRGTGSNFALLPPENATGNFVKVVQRIPVKVFLDPSATNAALSPGMSVVTRIEVRKAPWPISLFIN